MSILVIFHFFILLLFSGVYYYYYYYYYHYYYFGVNYSFNTCLILAFYVLHVISQTEINQ